MLKSFLSFIAFILAGLQGVAAQSYVMSGIEKTDKGQMQYEVLGKVEGRYWIYKNNEGVSTIAQYNDQMQLVQQNDLVFLPKKLNAIEFITKSNRVYAFYQFQAATTVYAMVAELDEKGEWIKFTEKFGSNHRGKYKNCGKWAFPVFPNNLSLVGSQPTPYIFDDRAEPSAIAEQYGIE